VAVALDSTRCTGSAMIRNMPPLKSSRHCRKPSAAAREGRIEPVGGSPWKVRSLARLGRPFALTQSIAFCRGAAALVLQLIACAKRSVRGAGSNARPYGDTLVLRHPFRETLPLSAVPRFPGHTR
jgi:hypothetical protein